MNHPLPPAAPPQYAGVPTYPYLAQPGYAAPQYQPHGYSGRPQAAQALLPAAPAYPRLGPNGQPLFEVRLIQHVGMAVAWSQRSYTVRGTHQQCLAAIAEAQKLNLLAGWWSMCSLLAMNWIALGNNALERRRLNCQAAEFAPARPAAPSPSMPQPR